MAQTAEGISGSIGDIIWDPVRSQAFVDDDLQAGMQYSVRSRIAVGMHPGRRPVRPEHMVPLALFLASQDASGVTGTMFDVMEWNAEHGFGDYNTWFERSLPDDLEQAFAAVEAAAR